MRQTTKLWVGLGTFATLSTIGVASDEQKIVVLDLGSSVWAAQSGEGGEAANPASAQGGEAGVGTGTFQGDLDDALGKIMAGEGGEGGAGLTPMWPSVTAPALSGAEVKKVVAGNTLRTEHHVGYYFAPNGAMEGWRIEWGEVPLAQCPSPDVKGDAYILNKARTNCFKSTETALRGTWTVTGNQLCMDLKWAGGGSRNCRYVTILLDDIAWFDGGGKIDGKGMQLKKGNMLAH